MATNGAPKSQKKKGAPIEITVNSQKSAAPPQTKLNGINKRSKGLK